MSRIKIGLSVDITLQKFYLVNYATKLHCRMVYQCSYIVRRTGLYKKKASVLKTTILLAPKMPKKHTAAHYRLADIAL